MIKNSQNHLKIVVVQIINSNGEELHLKILMLKYFLNINDF